MMSLCSKAKLQLLVVFMPSLVVKNNQITKSIDSDFTVTALTTCEPERSVAMMLSFLCTDTQIKQSLL